MTFVMILSFEFLIVGELIGKLMILIIQIEVYNVDLKLS